MEFKNSSFKNIGTISSTTTVDGLTLVATDSLTMQVKAKNATVSGTDDTYAWRLVGEVTKTAGAVKVPVSGNDVIKVTLTKFFKHRRKNFRLLLIQQEIN